MQGMNDGFYFVVDKIIDLQAFFLKQSYSICYVALLIAVLLAALNYALTGTGLKENVIKIGKALVFFFIVAFVYPNIVGFITSWTFSLAQGSMLSTVEEYYDNKTSVVLDEAEADKNRAPGGGNYGQPARRQKTAAKEVLNSLNDPRELLGDKILETRSRAKINYTVVAPAAVLSAVFLVAQGCLTYADEARILGGSLPDFSAVLKGFGPNPH